MSKLVFETGFINGDDRGSVMPIGKYVTTVATKDEDTYIDSIGSAFYKALEQLSEEEFNYQHCAWVEKFRSFEDLDEKQQMLTVWDYDDQVKAKSTPKNKQDTVKGLVRDALLSKRWDSFADYDDDDVTDENVDEFLNRIDWNAVFAVPKAPQPSKVAIDSKVYVIIGRKVEELTYVGSAPSGSFIRSGDTIACNDEQFKIVPADFVDSLKADVEAFPLPASLGNYGKLKWFARTKQDKKIEEFGALKRDAILAAKVRLAEKLYWAV